MGASGDRNVQALVSVSTHKALRDIAYSQGLTLRDLIKKVLKEYAAKNLIEHEIELPPTKQAL